MDSSQPHEIDPRQPEISTGTLPDHPHALQRVPLTAEDTLTVHRRRVDNNSSTDTAPHVDITQADLNLDTIPNVPICRIHQNYKTATSMDTILAPHKNTFAQAFNHIKESAKVCATWLLALHRAHDIPETERGKDHINHRMPATLHTGINNAMIEEDIHRAQEHIANTLLQELMRVLPLSAPRAIVASVEAAALPRNSFPTTHQLTNFNRMLRDKIWFMPSTEQPSILVALHDVAVDVVSECSRTASRALSNRSFSQSSKDKKEKKRKRNSKAHKIKLNRKSE